MVIKRKSSKTLFHPILIVIFFMTKVKTTKVIIPASPQEVYQDAYVDPKKRSEFTGYKAAGKAVVGGKYTGIDDHISGKYLELENGETHSFGMDFPSIMIMVPSKLRVIFQ